MSPFLLKRVLFASEKQKPQQYYLRHLRVDVKQHLTMFLIAFLVRIKPSINRRRTKYNNIKIINYSPHNN